MGASITAIRVRAGTVDLPRDRLDVALGFDTAEEYLADGNPYFGGTVGRVANRIARGSFKLGDKVFKLAKNDGGKNHLHGGITVRTF